ncbi:hypothetical protein GQ457_08G025410 [Hibiscus cannabinus]
MRSKKSKQGWMAIKVDLEKAFGRICWDFLRETLLDVGFPPSLVRIIMHCVSSSLVQVQWNGTLSPPFKPEKGVRKGDPLSPYLFVLTMERLGHAIRQAVAQGSWVPFRLKLIRLSDASFEGSSNESRKVLLVNWFAISQPWNRGGLGIPHSNERNLAFMQNLSFSLICYPNTFWVHALGQKYRMRCACPLSISRSACTPLWRALSSVWEAVRENVPFLGSLRLWLRVLFHEVVKLQFEDLILPSGQWDVARLEELLHCAVVPDVMRILPPALDESHDVAVWRGSSTGIFTIAYAYARDLEPLWEAFDSKWSQLWSLPVTEHIRLFIWLVLRQRLMTNEEHCRRSFSLDSSCLSCGCVRESILHVLRDFPLRGIYGCSSFLKAAMQCFFLSRCLNGSTVTCTLASLLATTPYHVEAYKISTAWAAYFANTCVSPRPRPTPTLIYHQWKKPPLGWLCFNTDASISPTNVVGTIGGALCDSSGAWLRGFCKCVGKVSTLQAELWSIYVDFQVAWNLGTTRLVIQSDSLQAIKFVCDPSALRHSMQLVRATDALGLNHWSLDFQWIPREMNMVADCLSKLDPPSQYQLKVFVDEPDAIQPLIIRDVEIPPYGRPCRDSHSAS